MYRRTVTLSLLTHLFAASTILTPVVGHALQVTGPSSSVLPYLDTHLPGVTVESILTVNDGTIPKAGGGTTRMVGIPDGLGVIDGAELTPADPDHFYLLVNHEISASQGIVRDHGNAGSFVSKWKISKATHEVVEGDDLIKQTFSWDESAGNFVTSNLTFDRLCSADRPATSALFNSASGRGSQEIFYLNGEETFGGRAFAHQVTGTNAGTSYHLPHFGYAAFENVLLSPTEQDATVAIMLDDASNGEVYVYVGQKTAAGSEVERAGLMNGNLYAIAVEGKPYELDDNLNAAIANSETFTLKLIGTPGDRPMDGADMEARGTNTISPVDATQHFESLKMGGPEDGVWDTRPGMEGVFYFATKGTSSNGINAPTRLWKLSFDDIADPSAGGTLSLLLDGPANRLGSLDNMTFAIINGEAKLFIQEDLGSDVRLSKIWEYDIASAQLEEIAAHDAERFVEGGSQFITTNEESSGIISLGDALGEGWFAATVQVHSNAGLAASTEQVEHGQLVLLNIAGRNADLQRQPIISSGDLWNYRVDGTDPGNNWNQPGFTIDANWNTTTDGVPTGPVPTSLGYGEAVGALVSDLVQPTTPRAASYYFRREFNLANPADVTLFDLYMKVDDGAVVYINGVEVARYNMDLNLVADNSTYASANEAAERDWKHIAITSESVPLQASGNVIAVSVHQENSGSSDMRMDMELFAWNASPDAGPLPVTPENLIIGNITETGLELSWNTVNNADFLRIERQAQGDVAWEVIEDEYPGEFTTYTDNELQSGVTYNYRLVAHNIHGRSAQSAIASATTLVSLVPVIFEENFDVSNSFGQFSVIDVAEPNAAWSWVLWDFGSTGAVQGNNYGSGNGPTEDWLITTNPINFLFYRNETLQYDSQISFSGPAPQVLVSTDYDPAVHFDPNQANWTLINEDTSANGELTPVGPFDLSAVGNTAYLAFKYTGNGGSGGQSARFTLDDVLIKGDCGYDFEGAENTDVAANPSSHWTVVNAGSAYGWQYDTRADQQGALNNNFGSPAGGSSDGIEADDWLISPPLNLAGPLSGVDFDYYENYGDTLSQPLSLLVTANYTGDPSTTAWSDITPSGLDGSTSDAWIQVSSQVFGLTGSDVRIAFRYQSAGNGGGTTKRIGIDNVCLTVPGGPLEAGFNYNRQGGNVTFVPSVSGGLPPYQLNWDFGDGYTSGEDAPTHEYTQAGNYIVTLTVTDDEGGEVVITLDQPVVVTQFTVPEKRADVRIATFNTSMNRPASGTLAQALAAGDDSQIQQVAEVIQRANPDIVLLNEFDQIYDANGHFDRAATETSIEDFKRNYLQVAQAADTEAVYYDYIYVAPVNTGVPSGLDFNNNGVTTDPDDAFGFGVFPGQYGMVLLSKHKIMEHQVRTFQKFRWKDMPGALLPPDPNDTDGDGDTSSYYNKDELDVFRLSSKSHWDIPVRVHGVGIVHILASHPTPPVFDDGTSGIDTDVADWNGLRNHDEIRFWSDYVNFSKSRYIYDDREWERAGEHVPHWRRGGLRPNARFVIMGDMNADPVDGDASYDPASLLLSSGQVDTSVTPTSAGALEQVPDSYNNRENKTASFNLRADYVLPSIAGWDYRQGWVFWPLSTDLEADLLNASDHRMVVIDVDRERRFGRFFEWLFHWKHHDAAFPADKKHQ